MPDDTNNSPNDSSNEQTPPDIVTPGIVIDLQIEDELKDSYLTYAMSTIMDRALPDVRDGLKPSQRRILVAMNDLGLRPNKQHRKCAKICGDTSGNYHPHGESIVYPTLVGLAQDWKMRVPIIDPQGNFGSIDGDPPAAMRYTEARLHQSAVDILDDLKLDTVDYQANYDDTTTEPMVLPGKFPHLLINGGVGIAVGMATSLLPHNPGEIFDAIVAVLEEPNLELAELMNIVPGPDFPTGGVINGRRGIVDGYETGRGKLSVRGKVKVEDLPNGKQQVVIEEIPYQLIQSNLVERIVTAVKDERIKDIVDIRNESGRGARTRIVCELRRNADPAVVENQLYQFTPLQSTISLMHIALVHRQPRTMSLREMISHYIAHRIEVIERRTRYLLHEAQKKAHILEGMIYAVCDIDEVIRLIRSSRTRDEAIDKLAKRRFRIPETHEHAPKIPARLMATASADNGVALSRVQAEAIGSMRLNQLVGLEIEKLVSDYSKLVAEIEDYEDILARPERIRQMIRDDCAEMKARYDRPRMTSIEESESDVSIESLIQEHSAAVTISHTGYVKRVPLDTYREQARGGRGIRGGDTKGDDFIEQVFVASTHDDLLVFTNTGRVFKMKVYEIPEGARTGRGRSIVNLIDLKPDEQAVRFMPISDFERGEHFLVFATAKGRVKRSSLKLYQNVNRSGLIALDLRDGDRLIGVHWSTGSDHLLLGTKSGMSIRFEESDARPMGRNASGVKGINLEGDDEVVGLVKITMPEDGEITEDDNSGLELLTVTENGYGKRTPLIEYLVASEQEDGTKEYRAQNRGGKGRIDIRTSGRNGNVVAVRAVTEDDGAVFITQGGLLVRTAIEQIRRTGRGTMGVKVVNLKAGDLLIGAAITLADEEEPAESGVAPQPEAG